MSINYSAKFFNFSSKKSTIKFHFQQFSDFTLETFQKHIKNSAVKFLTEFISFIHLFSNSNMHTTLLYYSIQKQSQLMILKQNFYSAQFAKIYSSTNIFFSSFLINIVYNGRHKLFLWNIKFFRLDFEGQGCWFDRFWAFCRIFNKNFWNFDFKSTKYFLNCIKFSAKLVQR